MKVFVLALAFIMPPASASAVPKYPGDNSRIEQLASYLGRLRWCGIERFTDIIAQTCSDYGCAAAQPETRE